MFVKSNLRKCDKDGKLEDDEVFDDLQKNSPIAAFAKELTSNYD
jgi:hypothetical protein